ncbi:hypothetical protein M8997_003850 [Phyllobacterium sp. 21LDTY02-6]|uniref:hypothetical protein n=1 Tax=Phyllobacterium sp. 21LDTY02-6 TaxID=2944903 RepID=UPI0020212B3C|nr:hypothetical protein [Phyllobacterium sp. 21LDTY02-6]MCO4316306.1 hypothetical protein [Phyllobacterium sp. 21LDTY02-6]
MSNQYAWYFKALELAGDCGELSREQMKTLGVSEGDPKSGFFRRRAHKDGPWQTVAIWFDNLNTVCLVDGRPADAESVWTFACRNPISEGTYHAVRKGAEWPGEPAPTVQRTNLPSDPFEALKAEFESDREIAEAFLKSPITTKEQADKAAAWAKRLSAIATKATGLHKVEKQPSLDESRRVDEKWRDLKEEPKELSTKMKRHLDAFLLEEQRKERQRQAEAQAEADRIRRAAEEAARKAEDISTNPNDPVDLAKKADADRLAKEAAEAEREAQARNATAGRTGSKVSLRTFVSARIVDYDKAVTALKEHPELKALVEQLANRAIRAGHELDGVERYEEQRAA